MSKIKIKNFGPIKEGYLGDEGWIDVKKVTVFIGDQGSGKSTVAKLITTFLWIEKALTRGDYKKQWFTRKNKLKNQFLTYFRLENYLSDEKSANKTFIDYRGASYNIRFEDGILDIDEARNGFYPLPQIMYVPAERNFVANVKNPKALNLTSASMTEFVSEFNKALEELKGPLRLPINEVEVEYNKQHDLVYIKGKDFRINLNESSSGFQSIVPLFLVSRFLSNSIKKQSDSSNNMTSDEIARFKKGVATIWSDRNLTDEQRRAALSVLSSKFNKTAFINIVEEPEQNLFPTSQRKMLNSLLEFNNKNTGNKLIITTHSPYIINYLTLAVKGAYVKDKIITTNQRQVLESKLNKIVPISSLLNSNDLVIYELDNKGNISKLENYNGIPSDNNYLNNQMGEGNELFGKLLDIEELCQ